jgi:hypothetical protein
MNYLQLHIFPFTICMHTADFDNANDNDMWYVQYWKAWLFMQYTALGFLSMKSQSMSLQVI